MSLIIATITDHWSDGKRLTAIGTLTASGSYVTGGDTLSFLDGSGIIKTSKFGGSVSMCQIYGTTGDQYSYIPGTDPSNGKVKINTASNSELGAGAYPARITGDTNIVFEVVVPQFV